MPKYKRKTPLQGMTKDGQLLSEKEEKFCRLYTSGMHRIDAIGEAYDINKKKLTWRSQASAMASENLIKPKILKRIRELLDTEVLNDKVVDKELGFLISQHEDFTNKRGAIDIYNKLVGRYAPEKHEHKFKGITDEEIEERLAEEVAGIVGDDRGIEEEENRKPL